MGLYASRQFPLTPREKEKHPDGNHIARGQGRPGDHLRGGFGVLPGPRLPAPRRLRHPSRPRWSSTWRTPGPVPDTPSPATTWTTIIPATQALLAAAREKRIPIVFTTTAYQDPTGPRSDTGLWHLKIPAETLLEGSEAASIDDRLDPQPGEQVIVKKRASAFHGTWLAGYLRSQRVDTVIITGVTMAGCVRHSTEDAIADGFRPIVVREAVGDRVPGVVEWNLFDIDAKFGDVEPLENVLAYLNGLSALAND